MLSKIISFFNLGYVVRVVKRSTLSAGDDASFSSAITNGTNSTLSSPLTNSTPAIADNNDDRPRPRDQQCSWTSSKTPKQLMELLLRVSAYRDLDKLLDELYGDDDLFYMYLQYCVSSIITRTKWKHNKMYVQYHKFITVSDEALTLLFLDNNSTRYRDLSLNQISSGRNVPVAIPKYTLVNGVTKFKGKGWNRDGKMRYMHLHQKLSNWRSQNSLRMEELGKMIIAKYNDTVVDLDGNNTRGELTRDMEIQKEQDQMWEEFLMQTSKKRRLDNQMPPLDNDIGETEQTFQM